MINQVKTNPGKYLFRLNDIIIKIIEVSINHLISISRNKKFNIHVPLNCYFIIFYMVEFLNDFEQDFNTTIKQSFKKKL